MIKSFYSGNEKINYLTTKCVIDLHDVLSNNIHLLEEMDPVEPRGIKNYGLLESAINRQITGSGEYYKYSDTCSNASTLTYGVIKNHAFHNGNKRAGFLALIKHLYVNGYVLSPSTKSEEIYEVLISIADSNLQEFRRKYRKKYSFILSKEEKKQTKWDADTEIRFLSYWIKKNIIPKSTTIKGEVKIADLKKALLNKGVILEQNGSNIEVFIKNENKFLGFIPIGSRRINVKKYSLGNNKTFIGKDTLKYLRKDFKLTPADGIDDTFLYDDDAFLDSEIKAYKKIIYQLSKT